MFTHHRFVLDLVGLPARASISVPFLFFSSVNGRRPAATTIGDEEPFYEYGTFHRADQARQMISDGVVSKELDRFHGENIKRLSGAR